MLQIGDILMDRGQNATAFGILHNPALLLFVLCISNRKYAVSREWTITLGIDLLLSVLSVGDGDNASARN